MQRRAELLPVDEVAERRDAHEQAPERLLEIPPAASSIDPNGRVSMRAITPPWVRDGPGRLVHVLANGVRRPSTRPPS